MARDLGSIYTPIDFANFLTSWAIQDPTDKVLDLGIGEGVFVFAAYERLLELGANEVKAQEQIFGAEIDKNIYRKFSNLSQQRNAHFPNLHKGDFFSIDFPQIDVIVGNPPYVRRNYINNVDQIRTNVLKANQAIKERDLKRLTDLYVYFILHALPLLRSEGRLATIIADSWLNVGYGEVFKKCLKQQFDIDRLVSLDRRVFTNAQVKPVLLLATKRNKVNSQWTIPFIRVKNGLAISSFQHPRPLDHTNDIATTQVPVKDLKIEQPWGIYFKASQAGQQLINHRLMTSVGKLASTRIGLQTLAKEFFVLTTEQVQLQRIEPEYLQPLAQSARYLKQPIIEEENSPKNFYVFYCSSCKEELQGTRALEYIIKGELTKVKVRGKGKTVIGYQNKERIKEAHRRSWYDLKTDIERRGRASILIPRLVYSTFTVLWNKAQFVPGELFIEFIPRESEPDIEAYLAVLTSTPTEIMLRMYAQVYGGGTYNINPGQIKKVPILDVVRLTSAQKRSLAQAYRQYLTDETHNRFEIDMAVYEILGFNADTQKRLTDVLEDLIVIATSSKKTSN